MFFQLLLLGGYAYAHLLQRLTLRHQVLVHLSLLALTVLVGVVLYFVWGSPILPSVNWRPEHTGRPSWDVFRLLLVSIGASYFLLSASSSLLQAWVHRAKPSNSPYVLYVVSNIAALLALLSYPFLIEPVFTLKTQAILWGGGFLIYVILCLLSARQVWPILTVEKEGAATDAAGMPGWKSYLHWITLAAGGVLTLMAVSNQMTQDVPPVPFLLVLPLVLFLLTYIIGFTDLLRGLQKYYIWMIPLACITAWYLIFKDLNLAIGRKIFGYGFILFSICLFCHNELYQRKPPSRYLTGFYLSISLGGALAGVFVAVIAPQIFRLYWEYQLCLILAAILAIISIYCDRRSPLYLIRHGLWLAVAVLAFFVSKQTLKESKTSVYMGRNFFGTIAVDQAVISRHVRGKEDRFPFFVMYHGRISHGLQVAHPEFRDKPQAYFGERSGVGLALLNHPKRNNGKPMRVGVIGLGAGTLATYGRSGDLYRFYEINPNVIRLAQNSPWFSYLGNSQAQIQVIEGDGRISMENELKIGSAGYDVLVLDAFSGDQIPMHLLTKEAFDIYLRHLADGGVIAINISNHYLDLLPVLVQMGNRFNLRLAYIADHPPESPIIYASDWALLSRDGGFMGHQAITRADSLKKRPIPTVRLWTDDNANLLSLIRP